MSPENSNINLQDSATQDAGATTASQPAPQANNPNSARPSIRKPNISSFNIVLGILFAGAIGFLYLLSTRNTPQIASAQQQTVAAQVETVLVQLDAAGEKLFQQTDDTNTVVNTFYYEAHQRQIPLERLSVNPFVYVPPGENKKGGLFDGKLLSGRTKKAQQRLDAIATVKTLELQSVLTGESGATAVISGTIVTQGKSICGWVVRRIEPRQVFLTWKNESYLLKMPQ